MASKSLIMKLAKLVIAAAWADGQLKASEINVLKDLIYSWGEIEEDDWTQLEAYMDNPVREGERDRLLADVMDSIATGSDKRLVIDAVTRTVEADGEVSAEEKEALRQLREAVESRGTGVASLLRGLLGSSNRRRNEQAGSATREERLDDFVRNRIYFQLVSELEHENLRIDLPEHDLRKLCLAAGMMATVAWVDRDLDAEERKALAEALAMDWGLAAEAADLVCRIALERTKKGLDFFRLTRSYFEATTRQERCDLLVSLFRMANAAGKTSFEEIEEIRRLARSLKLSHEEFIQAKLTIAKDDRHGM